MTATATKVRANYLPQAGDIIWLELSPVAGRRPCLVLSDHAFNALSGRAVICPITSRVRHGVFEVHLSSTITEGVVLTDHVRTVDLAARFCQKIETVPADLLINCRQLVGSLVGLGEN